jgi:dynein heavy chain, axonemal
MITFARNSFIKIILINSIFVMFYVLSLYLRKQYHEYRGRLNEFVLEGTNVIFWNFRPKDIFERYDLYLKRLYEIKEIFVIANEFLKLEKVEIGGLKGRLISRNIQEV